MFSNILLNFQVSSFTDLDKLCCLSLDEMELKQAIEYDPSSKTVLGQITLPGHSGHANHALVFMLGGEYRLKDKQKVYQCHII